MSKSGDKMIAGFGFNDLGYPVTRSEKSGKRDKIVWKDPYYVKWKSMIDRCNLSHYTNRHKNYKVTGICEEWRSLSTFKSWMETKDWNSKQLDKDIKSDSGLLYSPDTCLFITPRVNSIVASFHNIPLILEKDFSESVTVRYMEKGKAKTKVFHDKVNAYLFATEKKLEYLKYCCEKEDSGILPDINDFSLRKEEELKSLLKAYI